MDRFFIMPEEYGAPPMVTFQESMNGGLGALFIIGIIGLGSIFVLLFLLAIRWGLRKKQ